MRRFVALTVFLSVGSGLLSACSSVVRLNHQSPVEGAAEVIGAVQLTSDVPGAALWWDDVALVVSGLDAGGREFHGVLELAKGTDRYDFVWYLKPGIYVIEALTWDSQFFGPARQARWERKRIWAEFAVQAESERLYIGTLTIDPKESGRLMRSVRVNDESETQPPGTVVRLMTWRPPR